MSEFLTLEETDPDIAEFFQNISQKKEPNGIKGIYIGSNYMLINKGDGYKPWVDQIVNTKKIDRNDPCPYCLEQGKTVKWKKCQDHNN